ncbi:histone chaperone domain CHZ-domain-containing protein [Daldinia loculata]|uniref:histone chaperone domain CHZ-domain-containing protein n=1 Tax=Daldinia loculata TaxID=103429 RepID=UPI0020C4698A|nr:histone chaperone domain CHZ-domain-containing protein [Daldinia loculata]KAI1652185.1 histone chaperone domain CHZ-domain-containing protein [Daldinia loculata]KAI2784020.1 histone chaperone domain CHZ-domain-containing protein [Daldinia loculata]
MASNNGVTVPGDAAASKAEEIQTKGKGKAAQEPVDTTMDEDEEDEDEEEEGEGGDDDADDNLDEIDPGNIVEGGRRTRGRVIDWAKAAQDNPAEDDDDDDEDDYEPAVEEHDGDKMDED